MTGYYTFSIIWNCFPRQPTNWAEIWDLSTGKEMQRMYAMIRPRNGTDRMVMNKKQKQKKPRCITCCVFSHWDDSAQIKQTTVLYYEAKRGVVFISFLVPSEHISKLSFTNPYIFLETNYSHATRYSTVRLFAQEWVFSSAGGGCIGVLQVYSRVKGILLQAVCDNKATSSVGLM